MPTRLKTHGGQWLARVYHQGRQAASKLFPGGKKGGPQWLAAKTWELETKREIMAGLHREKASSQTSSGCSKFQAWLRAYIEDAMRRFTLKTVREKAMVLSGFADFCVARGVDEIEKITAQTVHDFLAGIHDRRGPNVANKFRKNLLACWNWGVVMVEGFPDRSPFLKVKPYAVRRVPRHVPSDEEVMAVLAQADGQDLVFILTLIQTGARKGELFRLSWADIDWERRQLKLTDRKAGGGAWRARWQAIGDDLAQALAWWRDARPVKGVPNVFQQLAHYETPNMKTGGVTVINPGDPFTLRRHCMAALCRRAGVKPFGFHALRHKAAEIVYLAGGRSNDAQAILGHVQPTTTNRYLVSAGLLTDRAQIVNSIIGSPLGHTAAARIQKQLAPGAAIPEANFCKQVLVN